MSQKHLKILHTSDIHLDDSISLSSPGAEYSHCQIGFSRVIDAALEKQVDLFLLAGDLFDHNRVKSPCLDFATQQLARLTCPVVMITGNHDCMVAESVYHRFDPRDAGDHIHFLQDDDGEVLALPSLGVNIWGKGIIDHDPENKPLQRVPEHNEDSWYIGMAHGHYVNLTAQRFSSLITEEEIEQSQLDYLALGHVHVYSTMQHGRTQAAYSGSPNLGQGVQEMTAAYVTLDPADGVSVSRLVV